MYEMYFMNAEISGLLLYIVAVDKKEGFRLFILHINRLNPLPAD